MRTALDTPSPFREAVHTYRDRGWLGTLPLPLRSKQIKVSGFSGADGVDPSAADVQAWLDGKEASGNIALRLPEDVLGIDVDQYDNKVGGSTLAGLEAELGPLPPTWVSTSREDGVSGIRLYRVPAGQRWPSVAGPSIEVICRGYRYLVAEPSVHAEGRIYRWRRQPDWQTCAPPRPDELPDLPAAWVTKLTAPTAGSAMSTWTDPDIAELIKNGVPVSVIRHDALRDVVWKLRASGRDQAETFAVWSAIVAATKRNRPGEPWTDLAPFTRLWDTADNKISKAEPTVLEAAATRSSTSTAMHVRSLKLTPASSIKVRPVRWLWENRIALGSLALLGGREGIGKSTVAYALAAQITRGELPGRYAGQPKAVIVAATEDSWEHTIVPRLMGAGADLDRVFRVDVVTSEDVDTALSLPRDVRALERQIIEADAALVLLDPLMSRLDAALDTHKDSEVRLALEPVTAIADRTGAAVLGLIHVNKGASNDALTMLMGSRAFAAVARAVLFLMVDPDQDERRLLGQPKNNLGNSDLPTLTFCIESVVVADTDEGPVTTGKIVWGEDATVSITEALQAAGDVDKSATSEARDWLKDYLEENGGEADSANIKKAGAAAGHSVDALKRARSRIASYESYDKPRRTKWKLRTTVGALQSEQPSGESALTAPTAPTVQTRGLQSVQSVQLAQSEHPPARVLQLAEQTAHAQDEPCPECQRRSVFGSGLCPEHAAERTDELGPVLARRPL